MSPPFRMEFYTSQAHEDARKAWDKAELELVEEADRKLGEAWSAECETARRESRPPRKLGEGWRESHGGGFNLGKSTFFSDGTCRHYPAGIRASHAKWHFVVQWDKVRSEEKISLRLPVVGKADGNEEGPLLSCPLAPSDGVTCVLDRSFTTKVQEFQARVDAGEFVRCSYTVTFDDLGACGLSYEGDGTDKLAVMQAQPFCPVARALALTWRRLAAQQKLTAIAEHDSATLGSLPAALVEKIAKYLPRPDLVILEVENPDGFDLLFM